MSQVKEDRIVTDIGVALLELLMPDTEISETDLFQEFKQREIPITQARFEAALQTLDGDWSSRHDSQVDRQIASAND